MNPLPKLTPRLEAVASLVSPGGTVADIGTDHAYLPVYLVMSGHNEHAYACDVAEGPFLRAARTVKKYHAEGRVELVMADGLSGITYARQVVVAGMGGRLTADILSPCAFLKDPRVNLVLQPMSDIPELRRFLCRGGFAIKTERVAREGGRLYVVMSASYCGRRFEPDLLFAHVGMLPAAGGEAEREYLERQSSALLKAAEGLKKSRSRAGQAGPLERLARQIAETARDMRACGK